MQVWILRPLGWSGEPTPSDFLLVGCFVAVFFALRFLLDKFVFYPLSVWLVHKKPVSSKFKLPEATRATIEKCSESLWKLLYYATVECCALYVIYDEPWFRDIIKSIDGWPNHELRTSLMILYMCQCGFYAYSIVALIVWETRRKDFAVMMSHHIITSALISLSYLSRFYRIGAIILALHDASDVFMELAKIFKYAGKELGASISFGLFAISWLILRLIFFPFWIIKACSFELPKHLGRSSFSPFWIYYSFNTMLLMLLVFHIYWWLLICSMIRRQLKNRGRVGEDIRSDSEDDE